MGEDDTLTMRIKILDIRVEHSATNIERIARELRLEEGLDVKSLPEYQLAIDAIHNYRRAIVRYIKTNENK